MHWQQRQFLEEEETKARQLVSLLMKKGLSKEDSVELVRFNSFLHENIHVLSLQKLFNNLVESTSPFIVPKKSRPPRSSKPRYPNEIPIEIPHPEDRFNPEHPAYADYITTKESFNRHMSQAMTPFVLSIAKKIADDRKLKEPDEETIKLVLEKTDWTRAAYEMNGLGKKPPQGFILKFIDKFIVKPLDKITSDEVFKKLWPVYMTASTALIMYIAIARYMQVYTAPVGLFGNMVQKYLVKKGRQQYFKKLRLYQPPKVFKPAVQGLVRKFTKKA
jgi:hypothetical protein